MNLGQIKWLKRLVGFTTFVVWIAALVTIFQSTEGFSKQAPLCMGVTMLIFTLATLAYKVLERKERQLQSNA